MKKFRWQLIIILITGVIVGILFLGEQGDEQAQEEPQPEQGGSYTEALIGSLNRLNPLLDSNNPVDRDVDRLIFSGLLKFDDRGNAQPDLAESWGISRDGTVYNFTLRQNAVWHDGQPVTTDDILFTIELLREGTDVIGADLQAFWQDIEVVALSEDTVQFRLPEPFAPFPDYLSFGILPAHLLADLTFEQILDDSFNLHPVGTGPYQLRELLTENDVITGVVLTAFEGYYNGRAFLDQIVFRYYPDSVTALQAYRDDEVEGIGNVSDDILPDILAEENLSLYTARKPEMGIVFLNLNNPETPYFQENEVRIALLHGINRTLIVDRYLNKQGFIANGVILPNTWAYYDGLTPVEFDLERAKLLLDEAGYKVSAEESVRVNEDGIRMAFELIYPDEDFYQPIAQSIADNWAELGISVTLTPLPFDELMQSRLENRTYDAALVSLNLSGTPDPDPYPFWDRAQATGGQNYSQWDHAVASDYIEDARTTWDVTERTRLYRNFQVIFQNEMPALPLYYTVYNYAIDSGIRGVSVGPIFDPSDRFTNVAEWYLVTTRVQPTAVLPASTE
jgi:peptide/nickel transport system substrate-binding protein